MLPITDLPIAIFDSGVGGLTVLKAIKELLPRENLIYLGDTARVPYGTKSRETIIRYTMMCAEKLTTCGAKMLVVACNTATSFALEALREKFAPMPVMGVVEPGARAAVAASRNGRIAVIGTEATIRGGAYQRAIGDILPESVVIARACTLLVPLAEEGWVDGDVAEETARRYLADIFSRENLDETQGPDTLLLGCTHFPLFLRTLAKITGTGVRIVDSARATAMAVESELKHRDLERRNPAKPQIRFLTTDNRERFARTGGLFLGAGIMTGHVELVDLREKGFED